MRTFADRLLKPPAPSFFNKRILSEPEVNQHEHLNI